MDAKQRHGGGCYVPKAGRSWRPVLFIALAGSIHLCALPWVGERARSLAHALQPKSAPVRVVALSSSARRQLSKSRRDAVAHDAKVSAQQDPTPQPAERLDGQVVDIPPTANDRAPQNARFLSEHNTNVERETRSRHASQVNRNVMNEPTTARRGVAQGPTKPQPAQALAVNPGPQEQTRDSSGQAQTALEIPKMEARDRLTLKVDPTLGQLRNQSQSEGAEGNSSRLRLALGETPGTGAQQPEAGAKSGAAAIELVPQLGVLASLSGGPANDHLDSIEEGEGTFLNSREFKYASFFNRLKRGVSASWRPLDEYRKRDPSGNIYGYRSRITIVSVTLKPDGTLKGVSVVRSSGLDFLDREAVSAFERAGPFPNPPKGLVDPQDQITFPFGFHVDFNGGLRAPF